MAYIIIIWAFLNLNLFSQNISSDREPLLRRPYSDPSAPQSALLRCHSTTSDQASLPTPALPLYTCMRITCLGLSSAYECKRDNGMLKFQKTLNGGGTATTGLLNLIAEIVRCCDECLWWIYHLYLVRRGNNLKQHLVILGLFLELVLITKNFTTGPFSFCWQNLSIGEEKGLICSLGFHLLRMLNDVSMFDFGKS